MIGDGIAKLIEDWWRRVVAQRGIPAKAIRDQVASDVLPPASGTARGGVLLSDATPASVGTAAAGGGSTAARGDHVHGQQSHNHTSAANDGGVLTNDAHDGYSEYAEMSAPSGAANVARLYAKDVAGITELFYKNSAGTERDLSAGGGGGGGSGNVTSTGAVGSEPGTPASGDLYLENNGFAIERYGGSAWARWGPLRPLTAPVDSDFAWVNQGTASVATTYGGIDLVAPANASTNLRIRKKAAPATPYTIDACIEPRVYNASASGFGMGFRESSSGKLHVLLIQSSGANFYLISSKYTNATTWSGANYSVISFLNLPSPVYLRIADDGTNRKMAWSPNGLYWHEFHTIGRTDYLTANEIFFFANSSNGSYPAALTLLSWKQT